MGYDLRHNKNSRYLAKKLLEKNFDLRKFQICELLLRAFLHHQDQAFNFKDDDLIKTFPTVLSDHSLPRDVAAEIEKNFSDFKKTKSLNWGFHALKDTEHRDSRRDLGRFSSRERDRVNNLEDWISDFKRNFPLSKFSNKLNLSRQSLIDRLDEICSDFKSFQQEFDEQLVQYAIDKWSEERVVYYLAGSRYILEKFFYSIWDKSNMDDRGRAPDGIYTIIHYKYLSYFEDYFPPELLLKYNDLRRDKRFKDFDYNQFNDKFENYFIEHSGFSAEQIISEFLRIKANNPPMIEDFPRER